LVDLQTTVTVHGPTMFHQDITYCSRIFIYTHTPDSLGMEPSDCDPIGAMLDAPNQPKKETPMHYVSHDVMLLFPSRHAVHMPLLSVELILAQEEQDGSPVYAFAEGPEQVPPMSRTQAAELNSLKTAESWYPLGPTTVQSEPDATVFRTVMPLTSSICSPT